LTDHLRRKLQEEIQLSETIVAKGADVAPRFRVLAADGEYQILVQMKYDDQVDRLARLKLVAGFMAWKLTSAFVVSGQTTEPTGIFSFAISADTVEGVFKTIEREADGKLIVGPLEVLTAEQCDPVFVLMMPGPQAEMDAETMARLVELFGEGGEMEAQPVH
jgi:hypothetical protein